jgi:hypothetical protein
MYGQNRPKINIHACVSRMLNWVMGGALSQGLYTVELYGGLVMFMLYIIFDTQIIVEDAFRGQRDFVKHAMDLLVGESSYVRM